MFRTFFVDDLKICLSGHFLDPMERHMINSLKAYPTNVPIQRTNYISMVQECIQLLVVTKSMLNGDIICPFIIVEKFYFMEEI